MTPSPKEERKQKTPAECHYTHTRSGDCCSEGNGNKVISLGESRHRNPAEVAESKLLKVSTVPQSVLVKYLVTQLQRRSDPVERRVVFRGRNSSDPQSRGTNVPSALFVLLRLLHQKSESPETWRKGLPCLVHVFISLTAAAGAGSSRLPEHLLCAAG